MVIELSTAQLAKAADGTETGPNPEITVKPDENLQIRCEGVSADFGAAGAPCVFSNWSYTRDVTPSGSKVIHAKHTVTVKAIWQGPDQGPTLWSLRVSGIDVDGAPQMISYHYPTETPANSSGAGGDLEKTVDQAAYDSAKDSPYVGTAVVTTPLGHLLTVPVKAHIIGSALVLYDPSQLLAPNGILPLQMVDATAYPVPLEALVRWVYVDSLPDYMLQLDARAVLTSFRQTSEANGPITARAKVLLDNSSLPFDDWGEAQVAITLHAADFPTCSTTGVQCASFASCSYGFCVQPPPPPFERGGEDPLLGGPVGYMTNASLYRWRWGIPQTSGVAAAYWPSSVWCVQPSGFVGDWNSQAAGKIPTLVDGDIACPTAGGTTKPWAGPFPFSHRKTLENAGSVDSKLNNSQLFSACLQEISRNPPRISSIYGATSFDFFKDGLLDYKADCINIGAVMQATDDIDYDDYNQTWERRRISMRAAQEWMRLHGFLMHQGVQQYLEEDVILRQTTSAGTGLQEQNGTSTPNPGALMAIMEKGVVGLLGQSLFGDRIFEYDEQGSALWVADYRTGVGSGRCATHSGAVIIGCPENMQCQTAADTDASIYDDCDAGARDSLGKCSPLTRYRHCVIKSPGSLPASDDIHNGYVPVLTDALTGYLRVTEADLNRALLDGFVSGSGASVAESAAGRAALTRYGNAIRLAIQLESFGTAIAREERMCTLDLGTVTCANPVWYDRWLRAATELHLQMNRAQTAAFKLLTGANPLGVPDDDTPIFFGDVSGTNSRYFASSDYLINTWADPAVKTAQSALATARDAWIAARNATVETEVNRASHDRRLDDIASSAGRDVADNCGGVIVNSKAVASRDVVPTISKIGIDGATQFLEGCFVHGGEKCTLTPTNDAVNEARRSNFDVAAAQSELCRLDYMHAKHRPIWDTYMRGLGDTESNLLKFMVQGTSYWCKDCAMSPPVPGCDWNDCATDCFFDYGSDETGAKNTGWKTDPDCQYRAEDCENIAAHTLAFEWSEVTSWNKEFPCKKSTTFDQPGTPGTPEHAQRDRNLAKCADLPGISYCDTGFMGACFDRDTDRPNAEQKQAAEYLKDCMRRHVHSEVGEMPRPREGSRSFGWQNVTVTTDSDGIKRVHLTGNSDAMIPVDSFYLSNLVNLRNALKGVPWSEAEATCVADGYPVRLPDISVPKECLHGKLGHGYQALVDIWAQADALSAQLVSAVKDWSDTLLACKTKANLGNAAVQELQTYLAERSTLLNAAGDVAKMKAAVDGAIGGAGFGAQLSGGNPGVMAASAFAGGFNGYRFAERAEAIRKQITALDAKHAVFLGVLANEVNAVDCALQVKKAHNALQPIREQIAAKFDECQTAYIAFESMKFENRDRYETALAQLDSEKGRAVGDLAHHYWYDEKVERFGKTMAWAKQTTYLALRAVEFEFQETLDLRRGVVAARHPDEVEDALLQLKQIQASRSLNRKRPEQSSIVLSLRDDILGIEDNSKASSGERNWTPAQRFMGRLWDEGYRLRDQSGKWLGQGVRFSLREGGALLNRCGERLWRVTATVQGDGLSPLAPGTPLLLLKRNTFYSQFCAGHGDGQLHQVNSLRPSSQLFTGGSTGVPDGAEDFSTAAIFPWFNVRRFDFYNVNYQNGASEELAGRGLYGDYILLFPKEILDEQASPAFPLGKVEDVLLRLDYLSVDNLSAVGSSGPATTGTAH